MTRTDQPLSLANACAMRTLLKDGVPLCEQFSLTVKPPQPLKLLKLNETRFVFQRRF